MGPQDATRGAGGGPTTAPGRAGNGDGAADPRSLAAAPERPGPPGALGAGHLGAGALGTATVPRLRWRDDRLAAPSVRERRFDVEHDGRVVPGLLWTPASGAGPWPLVLVGHGGGGSKREGYVVKTARRFAAAHGIAAAAIDGPVHGDRRRDPRSPSSLVVMEFAQLWANDGEAMTDSMVADWRAVLDALAAGTAYAGGPCGWWGLSMGTIVGLPFVAAEPRVTAAVLGLMGMTGPTQGRIEQDAPRVRCPVLFLAQWDDATFPRDRALALFEAIGSDDKRLHVHQGDHGDVPREAFDASARFLAGRLCGAR